MADNVDVSDKLSPSLFVTFICVFLVTVFFQYRIWITPYPYGDSLLWTGAAQTIAAGHMPSLSDHTTTHPGTTIVLPAAALIYLHITDTRAVEITMIFLIALSVSLIVLICRTLRPKSLWWLGATVLIAPDPRFFDMTPPSAFAALLTCIYVLLLLGNQERQSRSSLYMLGICGGILLATRLDIGLYLIAISLLLILWKSFKDGIMLAFIGLGTFVVLNPYTWLEPIPYLLGFMTQVHTIMYTVMEFGYGLQTTLLAFAGFVAALIIAFFKPELTSMPRVFLWWLLGMSIVLCGAFALSRYHAMRYFFPIILMWELFSPLILFEFIERSAQIRAWQHRINIEHLFIIACFATRTSFFQMLWITALAVIKS